MKIFKIGIVGLGHCYRFYQAAINLFKVFRLISVYDNKEGICDIANGARRCSSVEELIDTRPDVIAVLTQSAFRYEIAKQALLKGISVVLEKPPTQTLAEFDDLLKVAKENNCFVYGALHSRYTITHKYIREKLLVLEHGSFHDDYGQLKQIELTRFDPYVKNGRIQATPEQTSGLDSWPNILAELQLFVNSYQIETVNNLDITFAPKHPEVKSRITGNISGGGDFIGGTDWTQGVSKKITIADFEKALVTMDHTGQKVIIKGKEPATKNQEINFTEAGDRMTIEYYFMLQEIYEVCNKIKGSNEIITRKILKDTLGCYEKIK